MTLHKRLSPSGASLLRNHATVHVVVKREDPRASGLVKRYRNAQLRFLPGRGHGEEQTKHPGSRTTKGCTADEQDRFGCRGGLGHEAHAKVDERAAQRHLRNGVENCGAGNESDLATRRRWQSYDRRGHKHQSNTRPAKSWTRNTKNGRQDQ